LEGHPRHNDFREILIASPSYKQLQRGLKHYYDGSFDKALEEIKIVYHESTL